MGRGDPVSYLLELARSSTPMLILLVSTTAMLVVAIGFLVAASVLRRSNNRKAAHWRALESNWGAAVEAIAHGAPDETLHSIVRASERLVLLDFLYKTNIGEARPARRDLIADLARPYLPELARRVGTGDVWQRARAIRTLAELGGREHRDVIIAALDDPAPHVALTAARTYARLALGPIDPLLDRIERYQGWDRRLLRLTLTFLGSEAADTLHDRLADPQVAPRIRAVLADALADLRYEGANDTAADVLTLEEDVDLRAAALRVIRGEVSERQRMIVRDLCASPDAIVRAQAVACLARIARPYDASDIAELQRALQDFSPWVVLNAKRGLSAQGQLEAAASGAISSASSWE
jgi:HEAT repeat protein